MMAEKKSLEYLKKSLWYWQMRLRKAHPNHKICPLLKEIIEQRKAQIEKFKRAVE